MISVCSGRVSNGKLLQTSRRLLKEHSARVDVTDRLHKLQWLCVSGHTATVAASDLNQNQKFSGYVCWQATP